MQICAIIPAHRPDAGFPDRLRAVAEQVGCVVIVDDSASPEIAAELDRIASTIPGAVVCHHQKNRGLGASLNMGVNEAKRLGFGWVLTLDDDTTVDAAMCSRLAVSWNAIARTVPLGILAMSWKPNPERAMAKGRTWEIKKMVITSGSLMRIETWEAVGPFRENFIIDAIDAEYCSRVRAQGLRVVKLAEQGFAQQLGESLLIRWGPLRIQLNEHSPLRTYYRVRNSTVLVKERWRQDPAYIAGALYCDCQQLLAALLFYRDKMRHLKAMAIGLQHGCVGVSGFFPTGGQL